MRVDQDQCSWACFSASMAGGIACSLPLVTYYVSINPGHTAHAGAYNSVYALAMGAPPSAFVEAAYPLSKTQN